MKLKIASRLDPIKPSITLAVTAKAARLKAEGVDVISFGAGEPDFDTPEHIKQAVRDGLEKGIGKYTDVAGIAILRKAIASEMSRVHHAKIEAENVLVSAGAKHSLFNLFMALIDPGDEVLIPAPYWVSYPDMVMLAGGKPVILPTKAEDDFAVTAAQVAAACTPKTRAIVLNNPSNPTGAVYTRAQIEALAKVVLDKDILVISDDIYRSLVYAGAEYVSIAAISPELADHTVLIDGVSKTYAMTGWRIGYTATTAALSPLVKAMSKIQGQSTSNATHAAQVATFAALTGTQEPVETMRRAFDERRIEMVKLLRAIPNVKCREPKGAFYAFPDLAAYVGKTSPEGKVLASDVELCDWLVDVGRVAVVPGSGFGATGHVRLSYATSMPNIQEGVGRLGRALGTLDVIRVLALVAALGCQNADKEQGAGIAASANRPVVLRLAPDAIEVEGKHGKHTFKLEAAPSPAVVKPVIEMIKTEAGSGEGARVVIWGRYDAPDLYNALAPELGDIPTTICLRDGANC